MDHINMSKSSTDHKYPPKPQEPTTVVPVNSRTPPLDAGHSTKIGGMCTIKHEIISPTLYELLVNTGLKRDTAMELKNFYNHTQMSINVVPRLREELLHAYQSIKIHSEYNLSNIVITLPIF